jgi:hypothetical protein
MPRPFIFAVAFAAALFATASAETGERVSTLDDQRAVGITIYNADLALVRDRRHVALPQGESRLALRDVSARIQPETALLQSVGNPGRIGVLEQNFNYDLLSPQKLLEKYVGRDVDVYHVDRRTGERRRERARVLATNGGVVLRYADRIETSVDGTLAFPSLPADLRDRPTLVTDLTNASPGDQTRAAHPTATRACSSWRATSTSCATRSSRPRCR